MRILHIIASVDPAGGGPIEAIRRLAETSAFAHIRSEIVSLDPPDAPWVSSSPLTTHATGALSLAAQRKLVKVVPWVRYGASRRFVAWLRQNQQSYDLIIVHGLWNFTTLGFALAGLGAGKRYVVFAHGMLDPWFRRAHPLKHLAKSLLWLLADGQVINHAEAVLFTCEEERLQASNAFRPYHPRERVIAFGTGDAPPDAVATDLPGLIGRSYLLFLGRIHPKKGCDLLIRAFAEISEAHPDLDLVIAGPGPADLRASLQHIARAAGVEHRIRWPGMLSGPAKWGALRGAAALVLPSHQENFGIVVAEALACATPVLLSNKVNIWREVVAGGGGFVEPDTIEGTTRLLRRFLDLSLEQRAQMARRARESYEQSFTMENAARDLLQALGVAEGVPA